MISLMHYGGRFPRNALVLSLGVWICSGLAAAADGDAPGGLYQIQPRDKKGLRHLDKRTTTGGTLGYGAPGVYPGFQGFGLGYHLGYGYGGDALGPGAEGGYPFFGGPGYPHCDPVLRRCGGITAFPYFGGPGFPTPDHPNFYGGVGPLVADKPVITIGDDRYDTGYGCFTGAIPYPESVLAPFTTMAAAGGSASGVTEPSAATPGANAPTDMGRNVNQPIEGGRSLGIDSEPVVDSDGTRGMKIIKVYDGSAAAKAGLRAGDVIRSVNGYRTESLGNLEWIKLNAAPGDVLMINVRSANDNEPHTVEDPLR